MGLGSSTTNTNSIAFLKHSLFFIYLTKHMKYFNQKKNTFIFPSIPMLHLAIFVLLMFSKSLLLLAQTPNLTIATDKQALLLFKSQIIIESSPNPLSNWDQNLPHCNWTGVLCSENEKRVVGLNLSNMGLKGFVSPHIGNLSFLESLELQNNWFTGPIPNEIGNLSRLKLLNMSYNEIQSELPQNLTMWVELRSLDLMQNKIHGTIPEGITKLKNLRVLNLRQNQISGQIPPSVGNISSLVVLNLGTNNLSGLIPDDVARLRSLQLLDLSINYLIGSVPEKIYNMSSLVNLVLASNDFTGDIPYNVGITLPNLLTFVFCHNRFTGTIPGSLHNLTNIQVIRVSDNLLHGTVPSGLGNLPELHMYIIGYNSIVSTGDNGLDFLSSLSNSTRLEYLYIDYNRLEGLIPENIGNLSKKLSFMFMGGNRIYGKIPSSIGSLSGLGVLSLADNSIFGEIPHEIGQLQSLVELDLAGNKLSGKIPPSLGDLAELSEIDLSRNDLEGTIPHNLGNLRNLLIMDLSKNKLFGSIPKEILNLKNLNNKLNLSNNFLNGSLPRDIGKLNIIVTIDISRNGLSGPIPDSIGDCKSLEKLILANNIFTGQIPDTLAEVKGLRTLDMSSNMLSGSIPASLQQLQGLQFLNLSFNDLEGKIPVDGIFANSSRFSLEGNPKLCFHSGCSKNGNSTIEVILLSVSIIVLIILVLVLVILLYYYLRKRKAKVVCSSESFERHHQFVTYEELRLATDNFSEQNLIGSGSFGFVYRGYLRDENHIAVKVIDTDVNRFWKSFLAECRALKNLRHRNLVKLITTCSSLDTKGMDFLALVYELMSNGSLGDWILGKRRHENGEGLDVIERLNVAIEVACALDYMHNECETQVVHCDIKPSNILLDEDMTVKVGDFGLAKLIISGDQSSLGTTNGLKGSIGYIPPEYGMGEKPSIAGDVYSYGITLLELFTAKNPTNEIFTEGLSLRKWVEMNLASNIEQVLDPNMLTNIDLSLSHDGEGVTPQAHHHHCLFSILGVGLSCTVDSSDERICIKDALHKLKTIRTTFFPQRRILN